VYHYRLRQVRESAAESLTTLYAVAQTALVPSGFKTLAVSEQNALQTLTVEVSTCSVTVDAKSGTVRAAGPSLKTFLASYGIAPEDVRLVRFLAYDEYRITLFSEDIANWDVVMSISPLAKSEQPLRLLIPQAESSQWIYGIVRIEIELND
jgi:hypothetical protein